jgi:hypothetical protein
MTVGYLHNGRRENLKCHKGFPLWHKNASPPFIQIANPHSETGIDRRTDMDESIRCSQLKLKQEEHLKTLRLKRKSHNLLLVYTGDKWRNSDLRYLRAKW